MKERRLTMGESVFLLMGILFLLSAGCVVLKLNSQVVLLCCAVLAALFAGFKGYSQSEIEDMAFQSIRTIVPALLINICIGMLISAWIASGTFSFFIRLCLRLAHSGFFLVETFLFCCVFSALTGSSWICAGTVGLALFYLAQNMQMDICLLVGAIVGGSRFGACISPISDSANTSRLLAGTNSIYDHIRAASRVVVPSALITGVIYLAIDLTSGAERGTFDRDGLTQILDGAFRNGIYTLFPVAVLCIMIFRKKSTISCLLAAIGSGVVIAILFQQRTLWEISDILFNGYGSYIVSDDQTAVSFFSRGGIRSMANVLFTLIIGMAMGGILNRLGVLQNIVTVLSGRIKGPRFLIFFATLFSILGYGIAGDSQPSKLLVSSAFSAPLAEEKVSPAVLSRTLEMSAFGEGIFPWTVGGVYFSALFGLKANQYWYLVFFYYFAVLFNVLFPGTQREVRR